MIAESPSLRGLSIWLNKTFGSKELRTICSVQYGRKRRGQADWVWLLDSALGKHHCLESWVNYKLEKLKLIKKDYPMKNIAMQQQLATEILDTTAILGLNAIVAGGAPRDWVMGKVGNDIDVFIEEVDNRLTIVGQLVDIFGTITKLGCGKYGNGYGNPTKTGYDNAPKTSYDNAPKTSYDNAPSIVTEARTYMNGEDLLLGAGYDNAKPSAYENGYNSNDICGVYETMIGEQKVQFIFVAMDPRDNVETRFQPSLSQVYFTEEEGIVELPAFTKSVAEKTIVYRDLDNTSVQKTVARFPDFTLVEESYEYQADVSFMTRISDKIKAIISKKGY